jgi:hypothetical protein
VSYDLRAAVEEKGCHDLGTHPDERVSVPCVAMTAC